ncbi:hypothetical protein [Microbacterium sp. zg.Y909]|uniref:hypothetical protein n=1 Tax=Microbacterium sp. zg.Y909 TaxID=2969413 RepID=UPI00214C60D8|nr:hypothetical protein [Microbacterium sp. zg.Y909]MCR2823965.1 hypothetical protein [Microbacterium sp. zg.Y909]
MGRVSGFASSIVLLAAASLAVIPAMIRADGEAAWGAIALGQSVGAIAAAAIGYGWGVSGPARIAVADAPERRTEYIESVRARLLLVVPATALAGGAAALVAPAAPGLAVLGAITAASVGVSANWYFVGVRRPFAMLALETVPRVLGTVVGIVLMTAGAGAGVGLCAMLGGMLMAFVCSGVWVLATTWSSRAASPPAATVFTVLARQRHGLATALGSAVYIAAPLVIVSLVAPFAQPVFALVDKLQRQVSVALVPLVTVVQGWVPQRQSSDGAQRARQALTVGGVAAVVLGAGVVVLGPFVLQWLGQGRIVVGAAVVALMGVYVAVNFFESLVAKAVLASLGRVRVAGQATMISAAIGLPLVAVGAMVWGTIGALIAVVLGLVARTAVEVVAAGRVIRENRVPAVTGIQEEIDA